VFVVAAGVASAFGVAFPQAKNVKARKRYNRFFIMRRLKKRTLTSPFSFDF
jgi:hypothetical protein